MALYSKAFNFQVSGFLGCDAVLLCYVYFQLHTAAF
jgi:hypothetical protein